MLLEQKLKVKGDIIKPPIKEIQSNLISGEKYDEKIMPLAISNDFKSRNISEFRNKNDSQILENNCINEQNINNEKEKIFKIQQLDLKKNFWTLEEDYKLNELVHKYGSGKWKKISKYFQTKSNVQCSARFRRLKRGIKKKPWSKLEDEKLKQFVKEYGERWNLISKLLGKRSPKKLRERYFSIINPIVNSLTFSYEEDKKIFKLYKKYGNKWGVIGNFFKNRKKEEIRKRFIVHIKNDIRKFESLREKSDSNKFMISLEGEEYLFNDFKYGRGQNSNIRKNSLINEIQINKDESTKSNYQEIIGRSPINDFNLYHITQGDEKLKNPLNIDIINKMYNNKLSQQNNDAKEKNIDQHCNSFESNQTVINYNKNLYKKTVDINNKNNNLNMSKNNDNYSQIIEMIPNNEENIPKNANNNNFNYLNLNKIKNYFSNERNKINYKNDMHNKEENNIFPNNIKKNLNTNNLNHMNYFNGVQNNYNFNNKMNSSYGTKNLNFIQANIPDYKVVDHDLDHNINNIKWVNYLNFNKHIEKENPFPSINDNNYNRNLLNIVVDKFNKSNYIDNKDNIHRLIFEKTMIQDKDLLANTIAFLFLGDLLNFCKNDI